VHRGAGAYEAGEESALLESLEGKRASHGCGRRSPRWWASTGARPSSQRRDDLQRAGHLRARADWFARVGPEKNTGPKLYCISGHVARPGVFETSMDVTLRELIYDFAAVSGRRA